MSGNTHADTIRERILYGPLERDHVTALAALDALLDELKQAKDANHYWHEYEVACSLIAEESRARERERARADSAEAIVERFHEAWWNWHPGDDTEPLDAAASDAACYLGTVISLNPDAASPGGQEPT